MSLFARFLHKARPASAAKGPPESPDSQAAQKSAPGRALLAARDEEALAAAIAAKDTAAIGRLVLDGASTKVRQQAALAVNDLGQLRTLIKDVRGGNDKSVYRILQSKREQLLAEERRLEQQRTEIAAVSSALERHSHRPYDALFTPTLEQLTVRWRVVAADAEPALGQATEQAIERAHGVIAQHHQQIAAQAMREQEAASVAVAARRQREEGQKAAAAAAAEQQRLLEEEKRARVQKEEAEAAALREIGGLIRKAQGALRGGGTGRAAALRRALEEKLVGAPALPAHIAGQLQHLDERLNELKDWKSFSVAPKRAELIEAMEELGASDLEPPVRADRIKSLQEEWRTLSRGAGENVEADWQRFHAAAQKAYEPCREYFAAQAQARQENLRHREGLLERLVAFEAALNWEQPDWRAVIRALRESKEQWRRHSPVERAAGKAVQERFDTLTSSLQARLDAEYARNEKKKRALIEQAQRLAAEEDSRQAIEELKELQRLWKAVGPLPRALDQQLWEELRRHCDAVYQKRQQVVAEHTAGLEARRAQAILACEELEQIAILSGPELLEKVPGLSERRAAFEAIGELPRQHARELNRRFELALERCEHAVAHQHAQDAERSWMDLLDAASRVRAYRAAVARNASAEERVRLKEDADSYIAGVARWPRGGLEAVRSELAREDGSDFSASEAALRQLCIRAEVCTDLPTPPEDQALRREYQVKRLVESMGQGISREEARLDELTIAWVGAGPTEEATYLALLERFKRCRREHARRAAAS
jgi:hypothetical protein